MDNKQASNPRSFSMPKLANVEAVYSFINPDRDRPRFLDEAVATRATVPNSKSFNTPEQFSIAESSEKDDFNETSSRRGGRKFGVFLTGSALGGIASTFWTYGQLKQQQVLRVSGEAVFVARQDPGAET